MPGVTDLFRNADDNPNVVQGGSNGREDQANDSSPEEAPSSEGSSGDSEGTTNPFLEYQSRHRNRLERLQRQKMYLMLLAGVSVVCLAIAVVVNLQLSTSSRVEPFYVAVDEESGEIVKARSVERMQTLSKPLVQARLREVIRGLRIVYQDPRATRQAYKEAWNYIEPSSTAEAFLRREYSIGDENTTTTPPALVGEIQRTITDLRVTPVEGTNSYNLGWIEREVTSNGAISERAYTGSISTIRVEQTDKESLRENPTGLYIRGLSWQNTSTEILQSAGDSG
jgi:type IV secretory pathway TrbF-like protein